MSVGVNVPAATSTAEDDPFGFDMSAMSAGEGGDDWESGMPAPVKKSVKKKRKSAPKAKTRTRSSAGGSSVGKKIGAFIAAFCVVGWLVNIGIRVAQRVNPAIFSFATWSEYTTPGGEVTFDVPGKVTSRAGVVMSAPDAIAYLGESRNFACGVIIEPRPLEFQEVGTEEGLAFMEASLPAMGAMNVRRTTVTGQTALAYDATRNGFTNHCFAVVGMNAFYTFVFLYKDSFDESAETRFLSSIRINQ